MEIIKKKLKAWELTFSIENNRRPTIIDIQTASDSIKALYKEYNEIKKAVGENAIWGSDLNQINNKEELIKPIKKKVSSTMARLSQNLSKKLIEVDSLIPQKIQALKLNRSNFCGIDNIQKKDIISENYLTSFKNNAGENFFKSMDDSINFVKSDSINLVKSDSINLVKSDSINLDISYSKNSNEEYKLTNLTEPLSFQSIFDSYSVPSPISDKLSIANCNQKSFVNSIQTSKLKNKHVINSLYTANDKVIIEEIGNQPEMNNSAKNSSFDKKFISKNILKDNINECVLSNNSLAGFNIFEDNKMTLNNVTNDNVEASKSFCKENHYKIKESIPKYIDQNICEIYANVNNYDKYCNDVVISKNKKRKADEPLESNNSKIIKVENNSIGSFQSKEVSEKKFIRSKKSEEASIVNLNKGNFVKLNLRVKRYSKHGGQKMSGAKYKRFIWKQRMKNREDNINGDNYVQKKNCYNCGKDGHWAKYCKVKKNSGTKFDWANCDTVKKYVDINLNDQNKILFSEQIEDIDEEMYLLTRQSQEIENPQIDSSVAPIYQLNDGKIPEAPKEIYDALKLFGYDSFKANQEKAVMRILCGLSTLVILSTGAGKSLIYQLAAYIYAQHYKCVCLIVSPLISLMQDQVFNLPKGIKGAYINNSLSFEQRSSILKSAREGELHFLLLSPEMLVSSFISNLPPIAFACIDEVHCLSEWSHHFRPSYLMVAKTLKKNYGVKCMLGLTATASHSTINAVCQHLDISKDGDAVLAGAPVPPNLMLSVSREENKDEGLIELLQGKRFSNCESLIVYCTRREQTAHVATLIRTCLKSVEQHPSEEINIAKKGKHKKKALKALIWDAECYHAGLTAAHRKRIQNKFMNGKLRVVVATVAFGMGIDKQNIRGIIHYNLPKTVESYIQEIGRAGRDGLLAYCHLFLDTENKDLNELKRHIYSSSMDRNTIKKLVEHIFKPCRCSSMQQFCDDNFDDLSQKDIENESLNYTQKIKNNICTETNEGSIDEIRTNNDANFPNSGTNENFDSLNNCTNKLNSDYVKPLRNTCSCHLRAMPIEQFVQELDIKEEGILTLLCYLELHANKYIENMPSTNSWCKIICYGGSQQFLDISKRCLPIKLALSRQKSSLKDNTKSIEFDIIELADFMACNSNIIKKEIANLQFSNDDGVFRKSGVMVEFSKLSFIYRCEGNKLDEEVDDIVEFLFERVEMQEKTGLKNLIEFYNLLKSVSYKSCISCLDTLDADRSAFLRHQLQLFLENTKPADEIGIQDPLLEMFEGDIERIKGDVNNFLRIHGADNSFTGRSVARIMHGIESPAYPAQVWSKARKYWRSNLNYDFNAIRKIATVQIVRQK